jgi:hypothetical protein
VAGGARHDAGVDDKIDVYVIVNLRKAQWRPARRRPEQRRDGAWRNDEMAQ